MKVQHHRPVGAGNAAIKAVERAKKILVDETEQRDIGNGRQARRMFFHFREVVVTDALFAALAVAVNKTGAHPFLQGALVKIQRHACRAAFCEADIKL